MQRIPILTDSVKRPELVTEHLSTRTNPRQRRAAIEILKLVTINLTAARLSEACRRVSELNGTILSLTVEPEGCQLTFKLCDSMAGNKVPKVMAL